MDPSNISPKRPCYRCDECRVDFRDYRSLEVHRKTAACPKKFEAPTSSAVPSQSMVNPAEEEAELMESLTGHATSTKTRSCIEALKATMAERRSAFETFVNAGAEVKNVTSLYKAAVQQKERAFKTYEHALNRERALLTITSEQEQLIVSDIRARALSEYRAALMEEQVAAASVTQTLYKQNAANEAAVEATTREQAAFIEAVDALSKQGDNIALQASETEPENVNHIEMALLQSRIMLLTLQKEVTQHYVSIHADMEAASKREQSARNRDANESVASTSGTQQELLSDYPQLQQMMDVCRVASDDPGGASTSDSSKKSS